tara:strand:- start:1141 stop:2148 length:1008 start_codon:yes stop_codon:yes gene_type:complete
MAIHYCPNVLNPVTDLEIIDEIKNLKWCRPPSGIPGNRTPRNVAVIGDGSKISKNGNIVSTPLSNIEYTSYPLFQCNKDSYGIYRKESIPPHLCKFILKLRDIVKKKYGSRVNDVDNMFNVVVCNYYTEKQHQINAHKDDERWLVKNMNNDGNMSSLIASLSYYPDELKPKYHRNFQIQDGDKWTDYTLENGSVILFSNELHRAKPIPKKQDNVKRINLTFRTLHPGLLGLVGYGNFYRYMSLPLYISICDNKISWDKIRLFNVSITESNEFCNRENFKDLALKYHSKKDIFITKNKHNCTEYNKLSGNVKPLCTHLNIQNLYTLILSFKIRLII